MLEVLYYAGAVIVASSALSALYPSFLSQLCYFMVIVISCAGGVSTVFWIHVKLSPKYKPTIYAHNTFKKLENYRSKISREHDFSKSKQVLQVRYPSIFGKTVDSLLQQLLDFIVRDYIHHYIKEFAFESEPLCGNIKEDLWGAAQVFHDRCTRIDQVKLIACDIVNKIILHFENIREAKILSQDTSKLPTFFISNFIKSAEKELEFLRSLSEVLMMLLLPRSYSLSPTKYFVRELLSCRVFYPIIYKITDPDFINVHIIYYIESQKVSSSVYLKAFENASNFDDFLKIIRTTNDVETLKSIRYNIVTKLMQATTMQNLNRAKGVDPDAERSSGVNKADLSAAKKLKKYVNQLTFAKKECEIMLANMGWDLGYQFANDDKKVFPLLSVLEHILGRKYLTQFLQTCASQDLVKYWMAVEELRHAQRKNWHQIGTEIFYTFIANQRTEIKFDKETRKRMEAFLLGDKGPEVFYEVQQQVFQTLEDKYYQPFLISDYYKELLLAIEKEDQDGPIDPSVTSRQASGDFNCSADLGDHSNYSRRKLDQLKEKLINKVQALEALRSSLKPDSKVLVILEKEVQWLQGEQRQLEAHLNRTEIWGENLGKWRAVVQSTEVVEDMPSFVLVVHMMESEETMEGEEGISTGWVVCRSLAQFQELHRRLRPLCQELRSLELPSTTFKFMFGKQDRQACLQKAKQQIQRYLDFILTDDRLNQSEAIYTFLSPSSDHLKHSLPSPKKPRFSFSTLFKSGSEASRESSVISMLKESEEELNCLDTPEAPETPKGGEQLPGRGDEVREATSAEPLFALLTEIFDVKGIFKYIRKTLIGFVQVTYGRSINRQIHDTIQYYLSEQMLHYYLTTALHSWWPGGTLARPSPERTPGEQEEAARVARRMIVDNVPELLVTLVGNAAAKQGALKVFDTLQHRDMNKQLFYGVLETVLDTICPELR